MLKYLLFFISITQFLAADVYEGDDPTLTEEALILMAAEVYEEDDLVLSKDPLFVSLGGSCHTALALRGIGLRKAAFPFDWLISTNHQNFIDVINDDFRRLTDETCFVQHQGVPCCTNLYYNIAFPHDFNIKDATAEKILEQWVVFKEKYDRRVDRFRRLKKYPGKVVFVRAFWSQPIEGKNGEFSENTKRAREIRDTLSNYFPSLDFILAVISYDDLDIPEMEKMDRAVEFRIGRSYDDLKQAIHKLLTSKLFLKPPKK